MRIYGLFIAICMAVFMSSCNEAEPEISEEKIVEVLADMIIADEVIVKSDADEQDYYRNYLKKRILEIHNLEQSVFDSTFHDIQKDLMQYYQIQNKVEERLKELRNK